MKNKRAAKSKVERFPLKKEPESCVGRGKLLKAVCQQDERSGFEHIVHHHEKNTIVEISRAIVTAIGPRFRLRNSIIWLGNDEISVDDQALDSALLNVDPNKKARLWANFIRPENRFTSASKNGTVNSWNSGSQKQTEKLNTLIGSAIPAKLPMKPKTEKKSGPVPLRTDSTHNTTINPFVTSRKSISMDKKQLRNLITSLAPQDQIDITFLGDKAVHSGTWTVLRVKTGRGKGGSKVMDLVNASKKTLTTGTPDSDKILNVSLNGELHGYADEGQIPVSYEKNVTQAAMLKETFKRLLTAEGDREVEITSTIADFNGTFTVNKAKQLKGRGGQIVLFLENIETGAKPELWSYRHSGVITSFTILGDVLGAEAAAPEEEDDAETSAVIARIRAEQLSDDEDTSSFAVSEDFDA